ncbi:trichohyalin-like [Stylophora pistillata]|uniref:trichohyalin-like n=1 Tax=Stylophora pistillata TaxID=50429 RepID=UPI000C056D98|nr:trichohyalin-like [Stylophora pistillata]
MDTAAINYDSWSLKNLRGDATKLGICFSSKDGVKTLARKLRTSDRIGESFDAQEGENLAEATLETSLSFEQRFQLQERELQMLELRKRISQEHREIGELEREVERERRKAERELERERREFETQKAQEEERRLVREEERLRNLRAEKEEFSVRESERKQVSDNEVKRPKFIKIRYWVRASEKNPDEDFVQWGNRTRRYLSYWMAVAEATGDADKTIEQVLMERLLDAVSPELRAWLKEQKPKTAEELGNLANLHVQSRKGPLVEGKYVSTAINETFWKKKEPDGKADNSLSEQKRDQNFLRPPKPSSPPA